jgi:hypothetical protein
LTQCTHFEILEFNPLLSDKHCPISVSFNNYSNSGIHEPKNRPIIQETITRVNWSNEHEKSFTSSIDQIKVNAALQMITNIEQKEINRHSIDQIVSEIGQLFKDSATENKIMKTFKINNRYAKRKMSKKPWFKQKCETARSEFFKTKNKFKSKNSETNHINMKLASKKYKKMLKHEYANYHKELNLQLKSLRTSNPKEYWKILNQSDGNKNDTCNLGITEVSDHFEKLNSVNPITDEEETDLQNKGNVNTNNYESLLNANFTNEEIERAINKLKNNKAHGSDLIINEYLKCTKQIMIPVYVRLFNIILNSGIIPSDWFVGIIKPIYKKKGSQDCPDNYRGITILSCFGKLFTSVLNNRLTNFADDIELIGPEQAGFRKSYSTTDHILTLKCIIDIYLKAKKKLFCAFIDFQKAFDTINRIQLW